MVSVSVPAHPFRTFQQILVHPLLSLHCKRGSSALASSSQQALSASFCPSAGLHPDGFLFLLVGMITSVSNGDIASSSMIGNKIPDSVLSSYSLPPSGFYAIVV